MTCPRHGSYLKFIIIFWILCRWQGERWLVAGQKISSSCKQPFSSPYRAHASGHGYGTDACSTINAVCSEVFGTIISFRHWSRRSCVFVGESSVFLHHFKSQFMVHHLILIRCYPLCHGCGPWWCSCPKWYNISSVRPEDLYCSLFASLLKRYKIH